jgi:hypothetical protein
MLYDYYRMTVIDQGIQRFKKLVYIMEMKPGCGFIKNEQDMAAAFLLTEEICKFYPLTLTS